MSGLPWVRFDTSMPDHPKILRLLTLREGHRAGFVHWSAIAYCGKHGTDGVIEPYALPACHGRPVDADRLVEVGLWHPAGHDCDTCPPAPSGGWVVHDYLDKQQASSTSAAIQGAKRSAGSKGNCVRWHGPECGCWRGDDDGPVGGRSLGLVR